MDLLTHVAVGAESVLITQKRVNALVEGLTTLNRIKIPENSPKLNEKNKLTI